VLTKLPAERLGKLKEKPDSKTVLASVWPGQLLIIAIYSLLTVILTYPVAFRLTTHIPGRGDAPWFLWDLWQFKRAIVDLGTNPLCTDMIFYPLTDVPVMWQTPINEFFTIPIQMVLGLVLTNNLLFLASFVLSGYTAYRLGFYVTGSRAASFIVGLIYAFAPYHFAHGLGHLSLITLQWLPLAALCTLRLIESPGVKTSFWAGLTMALAGLSSPYYLVFFAFPFGLTFVVYHLWADPGRFLRRRFLVCLVASLLIAIAVSSPFYFSYLHLDPDLRETIDSLSETALGESADLLCYVIPSAWHPVFGEKAAPFYGNFTSGNLAEMTLFLGYTASVLSSWAIFRVRDRKTLFWTAFGVLALVFSLGPILHINGKALFPLPYALLLKIPPLRAFRVPSRYGIMVTLAVSVLSGFAVRDIIDRLQVRPATRLAVVGILAVFICFESVFMFPFEVSKASIPEFYDRLAADPEEYAVLEVPSRGISWYQYYQTHHEKKLIYGYVGKMPPRLFHFTTSTPFVSQLMHAPEWLPEQFAATEDVHELLPLTEVGQRILTNYNIRYVILHKQLPEVPLLPHEFQTIRSFLNTALGAPAYEDEMLVAYRVSASGSTPSDGELLYLGQGWHEPGYVSQTLTRPMQQDGTLIVDAPINREVRLIFDALAYFGSRHITVYVNDVPVDSFSLQRFFPSVSIATKRFMLGTGQNTIRFHSENGCVSPSELSDDNPDPRCFSFGIQNIRLVRFALEANLSNNAMLLGYDSKHTEVRAGDALELVLYWRALAPTDEPYTVFVHLIDNKGRIWGQMDNQPVLGTRPTTGWVPGEILRDEYIVLVDKATPPGNYRLEIGMYLLRTMQRLDLLDHLGNPQDARVLLEPVYVVK